MIVAKISFQAPVYFNLEARKTRGSSKTLRRLTEIVKS